jgi:hypothetical protein
MLEAKVTLPDAEIRELIREELKAAVREEARWLDLKSAAAHVGLEKGAFHRIRKLYGLPQSKLNEKVKRYWAADLDVMMAAHASRPAEFKGESIIQFPSLQLAQEIEQTQRAAASA